ncbi:hypothetical protein IEQ34_000331 [Dendrobium chrysotoxum]|uniref:Uncharacterized protein n=1 Tax=Dendrobium chrysotoxum TaxID=161865 RepID=A0AAV7HR90_DENCH|nr:hypothetical protein IEQ34_000331 [Dendrobium chrysotoxum]
MASPSPGQILLPAPKGIILISLLPVMSIFSADPPSINLSGLNSAASSQIFPSKAISAILKLIGVFLGIKYPSNLISSVTEWGRTKWLGG